MEESLEVVAWCNEHRLKDEYKGSAFHAVKGEAVDDGAGTTPAA